MYMYLLNKSHPPFPIEKYICKHIGHLGCFLCIIHMSNNFVAA